MIFNYLYSCWSSQNKLIDPHKCPNRVNMCKSHEKKSLRMPMLCSIYISKKQHLMWIFRKSPRQESIGSLAGVYILHLTPSPYPPKCGKWGEMQFIKCKTFNRPRITFWPHSRSFAFHFLVSYPAFGNDEILILVLVHSY